MDRDLETFLRRFAAGQALVTVMTGAGISAESGIPTFRGPEGYWTVGTTVYQPQEMATFAMFSKNPEAVWQWYLYRMGVCGAAEPNPGHLALAAMEGLMADRFTLITQNVDGLHLRAGNSPGRTFQIHGNVFRMRCVRMCTPDTFAIPGALAHRSSQTPMTAQEMRLLCCPVCRGPARPHVLWFDEVYNEEHFRFHSSLEIAARTGLLLIVGTSGATNLPNQVALVVKRNGGVIIDLNIEANPFTDLALSSRKGWFLQGKSGQLLPKLLDRLKEGSDRSKGTDSHQGG